jgi:teichuronic acid biosynthesis glycosyltransferase TuaC
MDILTFTTLYPNLEQPHHGVFIEQRLRHLISSRMIRTTVIAPVPWFPSKIHLFGRYSSYAKVPAKECRYGIHVIHPRYPVIPKFGMILAPWLMAYAAMPTIKQLIKQEQEIVAIDAHYFYPDGVAAVLIAEHLKKPVIITALGSDINVISDYRLPRKMIVWAAKKAYGVIAVSNSLKEKLASLGVPRGHIVVLRNGVDFDLFRPLDRNICRNYLNIGGTTLLSVGKLIECKGHHIAIEAITRLPDTNLIIIGDGQLEHPLKKLAMSLGVSSRVRFTGALHHETLPYYYNAADAVVLASKREGLPNVLLESVACGTPVVATSVGGIPEIFDTPEAGVLIKERTSDSLTAAIKELLENRPDPANTCEYAKRFSWDNMTNGQLNHF